MVSIPEKWGILLKQDYIEIDAQSISMFQSPRSGEYCLSIAIEKIIGNIALVSIPEKWGILLKLIKMGQSPDPILKVSIPEKWGILLKH